MSPNKSGRVVYDLSSEDIQIIDLVGYPDLVNKSGSRNLLRNNRTIKIQFTNLAEGVDETDLSASSELNNEYFAILDHTAKVRNSKSSHRVMISSVRGEAALGLLQLRSFMTSDNASIDNAATLIATNLIRLNTDERLLFTYACPGAFVCAEFSYPNEDPFYVSLSSSCRLGAAQTVASELCE